MKLGTEVVHKDQHATVLENNRGWLTLAYEDGTKGKARPKDVTLPSERNMKEQLRKARAKYVKTKTATGETSLDCGDSLAQLLRGLSPEDVALLADEVYSEPHGYHSTRYAKLNAGQVRMNSGNRIRGGIKRQEFSADDVSSAYGKLGLVPMCQEEAA